MEKLKLYIVLRDTKKTYSNYELTFNILENPLSQKWTDLFIKNFINSNHPIEKDFCLKGWVDSWNSDYTRNLKYLCDSMNTVISEVNKRMIPLGYNRIDLEFTVEKLMSSDYQNLMNEIHHHFELLMGQSWNPSTWYVMMEEDDIKVVRLINNLCHEIEDAVKTINQNKNIQNRKSNLKHPMVRIHGSLMGEDFQGQHFEGKIKKDLLLEDYQCFSSYRKWGDVIIYYSQLGKRHIEAYIDQDEIIDQENISGHQYITGEFIIMFNGLFLDRVEIHPFGFYRWLEINGFDKNDLTLGLNFPRVAELDLKEEPLEIINQIKLRDDLYEIGIKDQNDNIIHSKVYDYVWQDLDPIRKIN